MADDYVKIPGLADVEPWDGTERTRRISSDDVPSVVAAAAHILSAKVSNGYPGLESLSEALGLAIAIVQLTHVEATPLHPEERTRMIREIYGYFVDVD